MAWTSKAGVRHCTHRRPFVAQVHPDTLYCKTAHSCCTLVFHAAVSPHLALPMVLVSRANFHAEGDLQASAP